MEQGAYIDDWVRSHKKGFARKLISNSGAVKSDNPAAIFMAGLPGAGKTEFTKSWIENSGLRVVRLDMDEIASQIDTYSPKKADKYRKAASTLLNCTYDRVVNGKYNFIMDGTFGGSSAIKNIERAVGHGYHVKVIYIYQEPKIAWEYTVARERVEYRAIEPDGFLESYYKTLGNLKKLDELSLDGVSIDLVVKNVQNRIVKVYDSISMKDIDQYVNIEYNKDNLRKSIYE